MSRKRPATDDYVGRHRIKKSASGQHKKDPLPPPDIPERPPITDLLSSEVEGSWSRYYDPSKLRGIDPNLISPVPEIHHEEQPTMSMPPWMKPKKKIRPRYITAAGVTIILAVPAFWFAANFESWTGKVSDATVIGSSNVSPSPRPDEAQIMMYHVNGTPERPVCVVVQSNKSLNAMVIYDSHC